MLDKTEMHPCNEKLSIFLSLVMDAACLIQL